MTAKPIVIAMFPVKIDELARELGHTETLVATEGYTQTKCHECGQDCWIGPRQLERYQTYSGPAALLCYICIVKHYDGQVIMNLGNPNAAQIKPLL